MRPSTLLTDWQLTRGSGTGAEADWFPATVPGAVQLDWARQVGLPDPHWDCVVEQYRGLEDSWWCYRCPLPAASTERESWLCLDGVDHEARILVDGVEIGRSCGIQVPLALPLPAGQELRILIAPAPKLAECSGRDRARASTKAPVSYGWDFHPDLIPLGLPHAVRIEQRAPAHISHLRLRSQLAEDHASATLSIESHLSQASDWRLTLRDPSGARVWQDTGCGDCQTRATLDQPCLWWPHGHGAQDRYTLVAEVLDAAGTVCDRVERPVAFRRARLEMAPGEWDEPASFPKSRSRPPMCLSINGRRIFGKGANVVSGDIFPGRIDDEYLRNLVTRAVAAHMNTLRIWGGAPAPGEAFYEACDTAGLMVIQEFPLACNCYPDEPAYLSELETCATALIERIAAHPCLILWSGGNELFNGWSGMTDQSHALRLLAALSWQMDPQTPFLPTLPVSGLGHGYYLFRDPQSGVECFELFQQAHNTGYTEFGVPGPAGRAQIEAIVPADQLWPPRADGAWKLHAGAEAWDVEPTSYMCLSTIAHYWGEQHDLDAVIAKGQWLQCSGLQAIIEEGRRQRPTCAWTLQWCLNEPWPTVANQALLAYGDHPKPGYEAVGAAMRPTLASARIPHFQWQAGELFSAELFLLHDAPLPRPSCTITAVLRSGTWEQVLLRWEAASGAADTDLVGPVARFLLPDQLADELILELRASDPAWSSHYRLATRQMVAEEHHGPRGLNQ